MGDVPHKKRAKKKMIIRSATEADGKALNDLFNKVFRANRSFGYWRWNFPEGPAKDWQLIYSVAEVDGQIIGQYAVQIRNVLFQGREKRFSLVLDNIVAEEYRRGYPAQQEMFANSARNAQKIKDLHIGYGFPNKLAYRIGKRLLNYKDVGLMPELFFRLSWRPALTKRLPWLPGSIASTLGNLLRRRGIFLTPFFSLASHMAITEVDSFPSDLDTFWDKEKNKHTIIAERDSKFLNWRFGHDEKAPYRKLLARDNAGNIVGYLVLKNMLIDNDMVGYFVDFLYDSDVAMASLVRRAIDIMNREGVDYVNVMVSPDTRQEKLLHALGFVKKEGFGGRRLVARDLGQGLPFDAVCDPANWYLTYADSDLI